MQSLRAYLELFYKIAAPKKGRNTSHFLENLYGGVLFLKSYGKALFETFRKNSCPENSQIKSVRKLTQPATLRFSLSRFSLFWLYPSS